MCGLGREGPTRGIWLGFARNRLRSVQVFRISNVSMRRLCVFRGGQLGVGSRRELGWCGVRES